MTDQLSVLVVDDQALFREIRLTLRRDYDAGEERELSKAERAYVQPALHGAENMNEMGQNMATGPMVFSMMITD